ncbi:MAG: large ribosomal subunit protein uL22 [Microgenomates group bacterium]
MEFKAYIKNLRISPKKLRFFLPEIKKLKPVEALDYLYYLPNKGARFFYQAIKSAIANAKKSKQIDENLLKFKLLAVEQGFAFKRFRPGGRGTIKPYKKRTAHIKIILETLSEEKPVMKKEERVKEEKKEIRQEAKMEIKKEIKKSTNKKQSEKKIKEAKMVKNLKEKTEG